MNQSVLMISLITFLLVILSAAAVMNQEMKQIHLSGLKVTMAKNIPIAKDHLIMPNLNLQSNKVCSNGQ